jgi:hypothetical protein
MSEPTFDRDSRPAREAELEDRVRKLETAVADRPTPADADAVADRVIAKLSALAGGRAGSPDSDRVLVLAPAGPHLLAPPPPQGAVLRPPSPPADPAQRKWLLAQLAAEFRMALRMYFDPRYRISRTAQFALPGILALLVFDYFFFSVWVSIPFLSPVAERLLAVLLAVFAYKLLTRELARYREVLDYLAKYGPR